MADIDGIGFVFEPWLDIQQLTNHDSDTFVYRFETVPGKPEVEKLVVGQETFKHTKDCDDTGAVVWDDAVVLAKYLEVLHLNEPQMFLGKNVIELGAGTGLLGMVVGRLGANVTITDRCSRLEQINHNIINNKLTTVCSYSEFDWKNLIRFKSKSEVGAYDIVLVSGCIYHEDIIPYLIQSIIGISNENTVIWIAIDYRFDVVTSTPNYCSPVIQKFFDNAPLDFVEFERDNLPAAYNKKSVIVYSCRLRSESNEIP